MAYAFSTPRLPAPPSPKWRRLHQRRWIRRDDLTATSALLSLIPSLPRPALARLTAQMIDRMDEIDGDPDFEDLREDDEDNYDRENAYD